MGVNGQVAEAAHVVWGRGPALPPQDRLDTRHQLSRAERLGQVIVGADLQAGNPIGLFGAGGEHENVDVGALPQASRHLHPVHPGQVEVENDQIGAMGLGQR